MSELRPIADIVRRVGRVPAVDPLVARSREIWAEAVGPQVAANSIPGCTRRSEMRCAIARGRASPGSSATCRNSTPN